MSKYIGSTQFFLGLGGVPAGTFGSTGHNATLRTLRTAVLVLLGIVAAALSTYLVPLLLFFSPLLLIPVYLAIAISHRLGLRASRPSLSTCSH